MNISRLMMSLNHRTGQEMEIDVDQYWRESWKPKHHIKKQTLLSTKFYIVKAMVSCVQV